MSSSTQSLRREPRRHPAGRLRFWIALAALIHAEIGLGIWALLYFVAPREAELQARAEAQRKANESIELESIDDSVARRIIADLERQEEQHKAEQAKKEEEANRPPGQVVEIPRPRNQTRPDQAKFVSEFDATVEKETKKYGKFEDSARQGDASGNAQESRLPTPTLVPTKNSLLAMRTPGTEKSGGSEQRLGQPENLTVPTEAPSIDGLLPKADPGAGGPGRGGAPSALALMPSERVLSKAIGGGTQDALKGVEEGEETALNSKRWRFASFFNRMKRQVADHWHPEEAYRRRDPTGSIYGHQNRLTILRVQLRPDGTLANVALEQPSGVEFLDDEAVEAFRHAQPFPNPPRQLVESSGNISFSFGFLFEISGAPRMFRFN